MDEVLAEALTRISFSLEFIGAVLFCIFLVQLATLFFKDNNGGFYLKQINETLLKIMSKIRGN